jgi:hypothetical protein
MEMEMVVVMVQEVDSGAAAPTVPPFPGVQQAEDIFYYSTTPNQ